VQIKSSNNSGFLLRLFNDVVNCSLFGRRMENYKMIKNCDL